LAHLAIALAQKPPLGFANDRLVDFPQASSSVTTATELAKLLYWLMVVGYSIRSIEVRFDMERTLGVPVSSKLGELPPGEML
jgi:hypothetical protein